MEKDNREMIKELGTPLPLWEGLRCVTIIGQIEGHQVLPDDTKTTKYEHLMPLLVSMEEDPSVKAVLFLVNTAGGDVDAGLGLAELIAGMTKPTASLVLGGSHSIGVPLAVAAKRSFISPTAAMTVHPVRLTGVVIGTEETYNYFSMIEDRILNFVSAHSDIPWEKLRRLMHGKKNMANDVGTVLSGAETVEAGIIDAVGTLGDALDYLRDEMGKSK